MADIFGVRVAPDLSILDSLIIIDNGPGGQIDPAVVFNGQDYIVVWADAFAGTRASALKSVRVDTHGVVIGSETTFGSGNSLTDIAFDGARSFVVWSYDHYRLYGRFLNASAQPEDSVITIDTLIGSDGSVQVAFDGTNYLVVWSDFDSTGIDQDVYGRLVAVDGTIASSRIRITDITGHQVDPAVCYNGVHYLVSWHEASGAIKGIFLNPAGQPASMSFQICDSTSYARASVASAAGEYNHLVVWAEWHTDFEIYGNCDLTIGFQERYERPCTPSWSPAIFTGPLSSSKYEKWDIFDVTGRRIHPGAAADGVFFIRDPEGVRYKIIVIR
jgi:hypothetical protein